MMGSYILARAQPLLITCEHAGRRVPAKYAAIFKPHEALLASHRGYDAGALPLAQALAREFDAPLLTHPFTRLLADVNRSATHPAVFSPITRTLPRDERHAILNRYHTPHRLAVREQIEHMLQASAPIIHIGVHSFTPELGGQVRNADLGLLYDPARQNERAICQSWRNVLRDTTPDLRIRMNYPYLGKSDGLTTALRGYFAQGKYLGIELEINQAMLSRSDGLPPTITRAIIESLCVVLKTT